MVAETEACPSAFQARRLRDSSPSPVRSRKSEEKEEVVRRHGLQRQPQEKQQTDDLDTTRPCGSTREKLPVATMVSRGNYKPVALRWPFLLTQMLLLLLAMTAVLIAQRASPDSDDSAVVDGRIVSKVVVLAADQLEAGSISRIKRSVAVAVESSSAALEFTKRGGSRSISTERLLRITPSLSLVGRGSREPANTLRITTTTSPSPTADRAISTASTTAALGAKRDDEGGLILTLAPPPVDDDDDELGPRLTWPTRAPGEDGGVTLTITNPDEPSRGAGNGFLPTGLPVATGILSPGTPTTVADNSRTLFGTPTTQPVARPSDAFLQPDSTTVVEPDRVWVKAVPDETSSRLLSPPRKWSKIVNPITTTLVMQGPPQTSVDASGFPVSTFTPPPRTLVVQSGGSTLTTTAAPDDGDPAAAAAAVTGTIVVAGPIDGSSATFFVIAATAGAPSTGMTTAVVSLIGSGTPITFGTTLPAPAPAPVTLAVISGSGSDSTHFTAVPTATSAVAVITTVLQVTTINGRPTTLVSAVLTITPTQVAAPFPTRPTPSINTGATPSSSAPPSSPPQGHVIVLPGFTGATYFAGAFLPTLLAAALAAPLAAIDGAARQYAPFMALASHHTGVAGVGSRSPLTQHTAALLPPLFQALPLATGALAALGRGLFAPLAAEAVGFKVHGSCSHLNAAGCGIAPGVSLAAAYALVAVLVSAAALVAIVGLLAARIQTGLHAEPWSIAGVAALSLHGDVRRRLLTGTDAEPNCRADLEALFAGDRFGLAHFAADTAGDRDMGSGQGTRKRSSNSRSSWSASWSSKHGYESGGEPSVRYEYGIAPLGDTEEVVMAAFDPQHSGISSGRLVECKPDADTDPGPRHMPFPTLSYTGRAMFMALLLGLMSLIVYYHLIHEDNAFELFMDSQTFGVRFFFAAVGSAITAFWTSFFTSIATIEPFVRMARRPQPASRSVLAGRPTNPFSGAWMAVSQRSALQFATALAAMAAELLPMLLANIPFTLTQTYSAYLACTYASLAVLAGMVLVLAASMFVRWPHMPVDPRSIAGTAYYVADSGYLLRDMSALSTLGPSEAERRVAELGRRYFYGRVVSSSGRMRMVVESVDI